MPVLPNRPLRVKSSYVVSAYVGALFLFLGGLALIGGVTWWQGGEMRAILHEGHVWSTGKPAGESSVSGKVTSQSFLFHDYKLDVTFTDEEGHTHREHTEFSTLFGTVDKNSEPEVRYDPAHPKDFALAWSQSVSGSRWASAILFWSMGAAFGALLIWLGFLRVRTAGDVKHVAERSTEVAADLISITDVLNRGRRTGARKFRYRTPAVENEVTLKGRTPLWADASQRKLVVLVTDMAPTRPVVLLDNLHPFNFTKEEEAEIRKRIETAAAGQSGGA